MVDSNYKFSYARNFLKLLLLNIRGFSETDHVKDASSSKRLIPTWTK